MIPHNIAVLGVQRVLYVRVFSYRTYRQPKNVSADLDGIDELGTGNFFLFED